jgi:hypothetical protein
MGGGAGDAGTDAGPSCDFATPTTDFEWAQWRLHPITPPSSAFTVSEQTITDRTTELIWQRFPSDGGMSWDEARSACADLTLEGLCGWRLPTIVELESVAEYGTMGPQVFTKWGFVPYLWSGTENARDESQVWVGPIDQLFVHLQPKTFRNDDLRVRCVRCASGPCGVPARGAGAPAGRYVITTDVVRDLQTGLSWQRDAPVMWRSFAEATSYCANLSLGGSTTWRVPNIRELKTLIDRRATSGPWIDTRAFTAQEFFWSSTLHPEVTPRNYLVDFARGFDATAELDEVVGHVRCVR